MTTTGRLPRVNPTLRSDDESVKALELFFDVVFVLALTQCTALMAADPTWEGIAKGLLVLAVMWWTWIGYSWLTSVLDPEEGAVRIAMFAAMAGMLIQSLAIPHVFEEDGALFAGAYGFVRAMHIVLFLLSSRDDPDLRKSVVGLAIGTVIGVGLIGGASQVDGTIQSLLWLTAILLDGGGPYFFGAEGWKLVPHHFAERYALIMIIALGESIVAIGVGLEGLDIGAGEVTAAVLGVGVAACVWWCYFDVVALVAARRLENAEPGRERNEIARDSFTYLHLPMIAGIVLLALGMKKTLGHVDEPLKWEPATAMFGGVALYLLAHVAFRYRNVHRFSTHRLLAALALCALIPVAHEAHAILSVLIVFVVLVVLIVYETVRFAELRTKMRSQLAHH
jgi:low temperature requirement protein LtrA